MLPFIPNFHSCLSCNHFARTLRAKPRPITALCPGQPWCDQTTQCARQLSGAHSSHISDTFSASQNLAFSSTTSGFQHYRLPTLTCQELGKKPPFHFRGAGLLRDLLGAINRVHWKHQSEARLSSLMRFGAAMLNYESAVPPLAHWSVVWAADNSAVWNEVNSAHILQRYAGK